MKEIDLARQGGTYVLSLEAASLGHVQIGRLGVLHLRPGCYLYIGSAHGPGGLRARVNRHLRSSLALTTRHWHIDHFLARAHVREVWFARSPERLECSWAQRLVQSRSVTVPLARFGASDCACEGHLFHIAAESSLSRLRESLRSVSEGSRMRIARIGGA